MSGILTLLFEERPEASAHLSGGLVRKSDGENLIWTSAVSDNIRNPVREDFRLTRASAS